MIKLFSDSRITAAILFLMVLLLFGGTAFNEFVWDDKFLFGKEKFTEWKNIGLIFSEADIINPDEESNPYYRPVTYLTFLWDYQIWRMDPFWYHIENVLLHALAAFLFYMLVLKIFGDSLLAFISSLIFAVHPAVAEPVNFIAGGRNTILCAVFSMGSLLLLVRAGTHGRKWVVFSLMVYLLALLSKEQAAALPLFLAAITVFSRNRNMKVNLYCLVSFFAVTALYFLLRQKVIGTFTSGEDPGFSYEQAGTVITSFVEYFRIMLFPLGLNADYMVLPAPLFSFYSVAAAAGLAVLIYLSVRKNIDERLRIPGIWLLLSFLPISNIIPIPSSPVADRYLYMPLLGMCLAAGYVVSVIISKNKALGVLLLGAGVITLALMSGMRNEVWKDSISLWEDVVKKSPGKSRGHYNLGVVYQEQGMNDKAVKEFKTAIRLNPNLSKAHYNLGTIYQSGGSVDEAIKEFETAIAINPKHTKAHYNLGLAYQSKGLNEKALGHYFRAVTLDPSFSKAYYNLAVSYQAKGRVEEAIKYYRTVVELEPNHLAHNNLGSIYFVRGMIDEAIQQYKAAVEIQPESYQAYFNLGLAYRKKGMHEQAEEYFLLAERFKKKQ